MRTTKEVLDYVNEQIWYTEQQMKDKGVKPPVLATINMKPSQDTLEQKYWQFQYLKWFINEEI